MDHTRARYGRLIGYIRISMNYRRRDMGGKTVKRGHATTIAGIGKAVG